MIAVLPRNLVTPNSAKILSFRHPSGARQEESAFLPTPYAIAACTRNRFAATIPSPIKIAITTSYAATNGGSFPFGASACNAGTFRNACTTATKQFKYSATTLPTT